MSRRLRPLILALPALAVAWALALGGFAVARHLKVTPEKIHAFLHGVDFAQLLVEFASRKEPIGVGPHF